VDIHGELIEKATSPFANKAAHPNAVSGKSPTTADFCQGVVDGKPARDIHGCTDINCTHNHVAYFEADKEKLRAIKKPARREHRERSRAVNGNGERPDGVTLGDFVDGLEIDEGSGDDLASSAVGIQQSPPPTIMKKSIGGVPSGVTKERISKE
jgi:hypothetical protein